MDFSKLSPVSNANPVGQSFVLKWNPAKEEFRFSDKQFSEMQLEYNSLMQYDSDDKSTVFIGVCPSNEGVFYKKSKGAAKGKRFKNARLSQACTEAGLDPKSLTLTHLGTNVKIEMYQISSEVIHEVAVAEVESTIEETDPNQLDIESDINADEDGAPMKEMPDEAVDMEADVNHVEPLKDEF